MRSEKVNVRSKIDNRVLTHVSEREARLMCAEDTHGDPLPGVTPIAMRLSRKKAPLKDIQLREVLREEKNSPCTLTKTDMLLNADGVVHPELRREKKHRGVIEIGNGIDRAMTKVEAWPETHDTHAVVISAGKVHGATLVSREILANL